VIGVGSMFQKINRTLEQTTKVTTTIFVTLAAAAQSTRLVNAVSVANTTTPNTGIKNACSARLPED
jgi:hypothetical protein